MSALLPLAKALHAIASGLQMQAEKAADDNDDTSDRLLSHLSRAVTWAADDLGRQARDECSQPAGTTYNPDNPPPGGSAAQQPRRGRRP